MIVLFSCLFLFFNFFKPQTLLEFFCLFCLLVGTCESLFLIYRRPPADLSRTPTYYQQMEFLSVICYA